uniref:NR LBD domain-containing protein n=1 Tax=Panagrolaimus superbus TaxID=310955 RepID=A0A914Y328_9BILA
MLTEAPSEKSDEDLDISRADSVSSSSAPILTASTSCSNRTTQTEGLFSDGSIHCDDEALKKGQILVSIHHAVCSRSEESLLSRNTSSSAIANPILSPTSYNAINSSQIDIIGGPGPPTPSKLNRPFENVSFSDAFYNPSLIFPRTPLNPVGHRRASIKDIMEDWRRVFVLYSDWLLQLTEFRQLCKDDQLIVAKSRFAAFHWWVCGLWTLDSQKDGICYSNGSYFPKNETEQCIPDLQNVTQKLLTHFVEPLKDLGLTDVERCALFVIALFNDDLPISQKGHEQMRKSREKFTRVIFNSAVSETIKSLGVPIDNPFVYQRVHSIAAVRLSKISILAGILTSQSNCTSHGILSDILYVVNWNPDHPN